MPSHKLLSALLVLLAFAAKAQEDQIARKLDLVIEEQQLIIKKLEGMDLWEIKNEIKRLKGTLGTMREVRRLLSEQEMAGGGSAAQETRKLQEEVRKLYLSLSEIPLSTRHPDWKETQNAWFSIQSQNPEYMGGTEIAFYKNQLQNLSQKFQLIQSHCQLEYQNILRDTRTLCLRLQADKWLAGSPQWEMWSRSWEKAQGHYDQSDLRQAAHFEEIYKGIKEIDRDTEERKKRTHDGIRSLYLEVTELYRTLSAVSLAKRRKEWQEYERTWYQIRDTEWESLAPQELKKFELDTLSLRNLLGNYRFEIQQETARLYQRARLCHANLESNRWAQAMEIYPEIDSRWQGKWQSQINLSLDQAGELEEILSALERMAEEAKQQYQKLETEVSALKTGISGLSEEMVRIPVVTRKPEWLSLQNHWEELKYIRLESAAPQFAFHYRDRLAKLYEDFQNLRILSRRELDSSWQAASDIYRELAQDSWAQTAPQWQDIERQWTAGWSWKKEVSFADSRELEAILPKLQTARVKIEQQKKYNVEEARRLLEGNRRLYDLLSPVGKNYARWNKVVEAWETLRETAVETLPPREMQQYFAKSRELSQLLDIAGDELRVYYMRLLHKIESLHAELTKNPWSKQIQEVDQFSQEWISKKPTAERVEVVHGELLETFHARLTDLYDRVQKNRQERLGKMQKQRERLLEEYNAVSGNHLFTRQDQWLDLKSGMESCLRQNYVTLDFYELERYEGSLKSLAGDLKVLGEEARRNLEKEWEKTQRRYRELTQNSWTRYLLQKNRLDRTWENSWAGRQSFALSDSEDIFALQEKLEMCQPFWWRPLPPQQEVAQDSFVCDVYEVAAEGSPSMPQWTSSGTMLAFQTLHDEHRAIEFLDMLTGQTQLVELYDPRQRWVAYPALAPRPYPNKVAFSGKRSGFYELYEMEYSRTQHPHLTTVTESLDAEKIPRWSVIDGKLCLFFISGNDLYWRKQGERGQLLVKAADCELLQITDFAIYADAGGKIWKLALCGRIASAPGIAVYQTRFDAQGRPEGMRRISELQGEHFAPVWSQDGNWLVCYWEDDRHDVHLVRIHPETARTNMLHAEGTILIPPAPEMRFKAPQLTGTPPRVLYFLQKKDNPFPTLTLTSVDNPQDTWELKDPRFAGLFCESDQLSLSPDNNFLAWTYRKPGEGHHLAIAVVNFGAVQK